MTLLLAEEAEAFPKGFLSFYIAEPVDIDVHGGVVCPVGCGCAAQSVC